MIIVEALLNRLIGTGVIKHFGTLHIGNKSVNVNLVWNHVYALYLALIIGYLTMNVYVGIATMIAYLIGESKGWGEWVGTLTSSKELTQADLLRNYKDNEGRGFPYIHKIANLISPEIRVSDDLKDNREQYIRYARIALTLRGIFWWGLVYGVIYYFGLVNIYEYMIIILLLGIGFPIACELGKRIKYEGKICIIQYSQGWENQELVYGFIQGIALWYVILGYIYG